MNTEKEVQALKHEISEMKDQMKVINNRLHGIQSSITKYVEKKAQQQTF